LFDAPQACRYLAGRPSSRHLPEATERKSLSKAPLFAAAPEDFSPSKNTGATF
jgi:hypothetical protein